MTEIETTPTASSPPGGAPGATTPQTDWRAGIDDPELRKAAERFNGPADLVRAHRDLRRKLSTAIVPPGPDASAAEHDAHRRRLGVPDSPSGYGYTPPADLPARVASDDLEAGLDGFLTAMHRAGVPRTAVHATLDWYFSGLRETDQAMARARHAATADAEAALRREWGGGFERNVSLAGRALAEFFGDAAGELKGVELGDGRALGSHPAFIRGLAAIGMRIIEGGLHVGLTGSGGGGSAADRIKELRALQDSDPQAYASERVQRELQGLYAEAYAGDDPLSASPRS